MSEHLHQFEAELAAHAAVSKREEVAPLRRWRFWSTPVEIVQSICQSDACDDCPSTRFELAYEADQDELFDSTFGVPPTQAAPFDDDLEMASWAAHNDEMASVRRIAAMLDYTPHQFDELRQDLIEQYWHQLDKGRLGNAQTFADWLRDEADEIDRATHGL